MPYILLTASLYFLPCTTTPLILVFTPVMTYFYENRSHASLSEMILPPFPCMLPKVLPPFSGKHGEFGFKKLPIFIDTWRSLQEVYLSNVSFHLMLIIVTPLISPVGGLLQKYSISSSVSSGAYSL